MSNEPTMLEPDEVLRLIVRGPLEHPDGSVECRVCGKGFDRASSYGPHWSISHFRRLPKALQLEHPQGEECSVCGKVIVAAMKDHKRTHTHAQRKAAEAGKVNGTALAVIEPEEEPQPVTTATDAGLAILAGLRPGSTLAVEELPEVVEWLHETERIVGLLKR